MAHPSEEINGRRAQRTSPATHAGIEAVAKSRHLNDERQLLKNQYLAFLDIRTVDRCHTRSFMTA